MNESFFSFLGLREDPFHVSPNPRFHYSTPSHESALASLMFGIETRQGIMVLTGEAGTGKTSILYQILDWLRQRGRSTAFIFHTRVEPIGLLRLILTDFGVACDSKAKSDLVKTLHQWLLQRHAAHDLPVLILDEAQALPPQTLNEIRLILNAETQRGKLLQIILAGQPELEEKLQLPALRQLRQRVMFHSRLSELTEEETAAYIARRLAVAGGTESLVFPADVVHSIHAISQGIPRVVNLLCENALVCAYGEGCRAVTPEMIDRIAVDFGLSCTPSMLAANATRQQERYRLAPLVAVQSVEVAETPAFALTQEEPVPALMRVAAAAAAGAAAPSIVGPAVTATPVPDSVQAAPPVSATVPDPIAPTTAISATVPESVAPVVPPIAETMPDVPAVSGNLPGNSPSVQPSAQRYWRKYRAKSTAALYARRLTSAFQQVSDVFRDTLTDSAWHVRDTLADSARQIRDTLASSTRQVRDTLAKSTRRVRHALARRMEKVPPAGAAGVFPGDTGPMQQSWMQQIEFDILENMPSRVPSKQAQIAIKESAAPAIEEATVSPSRTAVASFRQVSLPWIRQTWTTASNRITWYVRSVVDSFVHDCRMFFRVPLASTPVAGLNAAVPARAQNPRPNGHRNTLSVVDWLRQPISPPRVVRRNSTPHPASHYSATTDIKRPKVANNR